MQSSITGSAEPGVQPSGSTLPWESPQGLLPSAPTEVFPRELEAIKVLLQEHFWVELEDSDILYENDFLSKVELASPRMSVCLRDKGL